MCEIKEKVNKILEMLRKMSVEEIVQYDIKNQMDGFPTNNGGLKSLCLYKIVEEEFDCDVSLFTMVCFSIAFDYLPKKIVCQNGMKHKYEFEGKKFNYRGDTMNSYATTVHEFLRCYNYDDNKIRNFLNVSKNSKYGTQYQYNGLKSGSNWEICMLDNYKYFNDIFPEDANRFFNYTHTIGNMIPYPYMKGASFNWARGNYKLFADYWDITLACIYNYFCETTDRKFTLEKLLDRKNNATIQLVKKWLDDEFKSWNNFITQNYLQDFVGEDGMPRALWEGHLPEKDGALSNDYHVLPQSNTDYQSYFRNASNRIEARGYSIATKIKKVLDKKTNEVIIKDLFS